MYRLFVSEKQDDYFILDNETLKHINVLRLKKDEEFICVYENQFYSCKLEGKKAKIVSQLNENHEFKNKVVLFAALINIKRYEWLIQKAVELGVCEFYPLITKHTNLKYVEIFQKKMNRFNEIIKNASEQSFRNILMKLHSPIHFSTAIQISIKKKYLAHEKQSINYSDSFLNFQGEVAFFVGPEGGFDDQEVQLSIKNNVQIISLGKRILRSETASIFLLSNVNLDN